ncbi:MAG: hypothetical protein KDK39_18030 [Leptospiraceae bacterium]|nr:hypothetical protein [Leptospiraceae bacterium]
MKAPKVYWKDLPAGETTVLRPAAAKLRAPAAKLGQIIQTTLADGTFAELEVRSTDIENEDTNIQIYADAQHTGWLDAASAIADGSLRIRELPLKDVGFLQCENRSGQDVYLAAGLAFQGGYQNRVNLEPRLLRPGHHNLSVFCIEAGRWQNENPHFGTAQLIPDLMQYHFSEMPDRYDSGSDENRFDRQIRIWELILESLSLTNQDNSSMDLLYLANQTAIPGLLNTTSDNDRGYYLQDAALGLHVLQITPGSSHLQGRLNQLQREMQWRHRLQEYGSSARKYFRIFDDQKALAIQCQPDGRSYKTLRGKPVLFQYTASDLQNSFTPPIEHAPQARLVPHGQGRPMPPEDFKQLLAECDVELGKLGRDLLRLHFQHPSESLGGSGLLHKGRVAALQAALFDPQHYNPAAN